ncbi:MAG: aminotransferase class I/II-fold pyridoxal phosphate-dependent enzyme [Pseudomonadota bacterium]
MGIKDRIAATGAAFGALKAMGRDPSSLKFETISSPTEARLEGRPITLFGTNNYLGLTFDPGCVQAAADATFAQGAGTTGSRIANGSYGGHNALETEIARFYGKRGAMVFSTGYVANIGMISVLGGQGDHLLIDADSHASIYDGCKMSDAEIIRFRHNSPESLAKRLERLKGTPGDKTVIVEGIYSMLGDSAPIDEFAAVTREAGDDVFLMVDEAHSLGVYGATGRGKAQADGVEADCDFIVGTFSKSVGTTGGYCVSDLEGFDALRMLSRPYMFTASMTPSAIATARAAFEIMAAGRGHKERLWKNANHLYSGAQSLGFQTGPEVSPVVAVILPEPQVAVALWNRLIDEGIYTNIAIPPATPNALSLLRVSVSAAHEPDQIDHALDVLASVGAELGIIDGATPIKKKVGAASLRVISGGASAKAAGSEQPVRRAKGRAAPTA